MQAAPPVVATPPPASRSVRSGLIAIVLVSVVLVGAYLATPRLARFEQNVTPGFATGTVVTVPQFGERGTYVLGYQHGQVVRLGVAVTNTGPVPVRISDIRLTDEPKPLVEIVNASAGGAALPLTLERGQTTQMELSARYGNCRYYHERALQNMSGAIVRGQVLGRPFRTVVTFDHDLLVHSPMIVGCPDRTLTRGDDLRRR